MYVVQQYRYTINFHNSTQLQQKLISISRSKIKLIIYIINNIIRYKCKKNKNNLLVS
jgi:hypothetical protein